MSNLQQFYESQALLIKKKWQSLATEHPPEDRPKWVKTRLYQLETYLEAVRGQLYRLQTPSVKHHTIHQPGRAQAA